MSEPTSNPAENAAPHLAPGADRADVAPPANGQPATLSMGPASSGPIIVTSVATPTLPTAIVPAVSPVHQLSELPADDLHGLAEALGLTPGQYPTRQQLVAAIHYRRQLIAAIHADALQELLTWTGRHVPSGATKEAMALQVTNCRSMRFGGLSQRALAALAALRGIDVRGNEAVPELIHRLKKREGLFAKLDRKRRALLGSIVSNLIGENDDPPIPSAPGATYSAANAPPPMTGGQNSPPRSVNTKSANIKQEIEEAGLLGGLAGRIRKSADSYVNQKLDEVEARIDRKLDDIDRRLAEWRDKELANRIRILKITLWASVVVGAFSLVYSYIQVYFHPTPPPATHISRPQ